MRRIAQQPIALMQRLVHQAEFTILQITQPAMQHMRRSGARPASKIAALDQQRVKALQRQIAKRADAVDPAADDQD